MCLDNVSKLCRDKREMKRVEQVFYIFCFLFNQKRFYFFSISSLSPCLQCFTISVSKSLSLWLKQYSFVAPGLAGRRLKLAGSRFRRHSLHQTLIGLRSCEWIWTIIFYWHNLNSESLKVYGFFTLCTSRDQVFYLVVIKESIKSESSLQIWHPTTGYW